MSHYKPVSILMRRVFLAGMFWWPIFFALIVLRGLDWDSYSVIISNLIAAPFIFLLAWIFILRGLPKSFFRKPRSDALTRSNVGARLLRCVCIYLVCLGALFVILAPIFLSVYGNPVAFYFNAAVWIMILVGIEIVCLVYWLRFREQSQPEHVPSQ